MEVLRQLGAAVMGFLVAYGYLALFLLLLVEEAGVPLPIPGDTLVMYSAYQAHHGHFNGFGVLASAIAGAFTGSMILYFVALKGGHRLLLRYGRYIHLHPKRIERMERRFRRWGIWAIIVARMVPGLRIATTAMAGVFAIPPKTFLIADFIGICIWAIVYYVLGIIVGESYVRLHDAMGNYFRWFVIIGIVIVALVALTFYLRRRNRDKEPDDGDLAAAGADEQEEPAATVNPLVLVPEHERSENC